MRSPVMFVYGMSLGLICGCCFGAFVSKWETQAHAIEANVAYYSVDEKTGEVFFIWGSKEKE